MGVADPRPRGAFPGGLHSHPQGAAVLRMSGEGENPASKPTPVQDVQGDGRWMSLHHRFVADSKDKEPEVVFIGDSLVQLMHQCEVRVHPFPPSSSRHAPSLALQAQNLIRQDKGYRNARGSRNLRTPCTCLLRMKCVP